MLAKFLATFWQQGDITERAHRCRCGNLTKNFAISLQLL